MNLLQYKEIDDGFQITKQWEAIRGIGNLCRIGLTWVASMNSPCYFNGLFIQGDSLERDHDPLPKRAGPILQYLSEIEVYEIGPIQYARVIAPSNEIQSAIIIHHPNVSKVRMAYGQLENAWASDRNDTLIIKTIDLDLCLRAFKYKSTEEVFYSEPMVEL